MGIIVTTVIGSNIDSHTGNSHYSHHQNNQQLNYLHIIPWMFNPNTLYFYEYK